MAILNLVTDGIAQREAHRSINVTSVTRSNNGAAYLRQVATPRALRPRMTIERGRGQRVIELAAEMHHS